MDLLYPEQAQNIVEAIEEGKIVKVSEEYAKKEGLLILRKTREVPAQKKTNRQEEPTLALEDFRKPLNWQKSQVCSELIENFHWYISRKRRHLGLTRKHLAESINESENTIKLIENGILPKEDFIILNKIQERLKINIRADKKDFSQSPRSLINEDAQKEEIQTDKIELIED